MLHYPGDSCISVLKNTHDTIKRKWEMRIYSVSLYWLKESLKYELSNISPEKDLVQRLLLLANTTHINLISTANTSICTASFK